MVRGGETGRLNAPNYSDVKELNFLAARSYTDHIYMCLFLVIIYMNIFVLFAAVLKNTVRYFMQMELLEFKSTHTTLMKILLSLSTVLRI